MSNYTPTTEDIEASYTGNRDLYVEEFYRWLNAHERAVAERAWDEGHKAPQYRTNLSGDYLGAIKNPYREATS